MDASQLIDYWAGSRLSGNTSFDSGGRVDPVSGSQNFVVKFFFSTIVYIVFNLVFQRLHEPSLRPPRLSSWKFLFQTHALRRNPTVVLHNLVKRYGPVTHVKLWSQDVLVLSSVAAVEEFYKIHDMEFGARPSSMNRVTLSNTINSSCFPPLATYWNHLRYVLDMATLTPFDKGTTCGFEWALEALQHHPGIVAGICDEVERKLCSKSHIEDSDIAKLPYLQAVVKELFRLYPPCAFSFPHVSSDEHCHIFGFEVSPGTQVLISIYSIQRDPAVWTNPDEFQPSRFITHPRIDMHGQHYQLLPFGGGRRQCPATKLAIGHVQSGLARYFHNACSLHRIPQSTCQEVNL